MTDNPKSINTGESSRDSLGRGGIINPTHGGGLTRKVENAVENRQNEQLEHQVSSKKIYLDNAGNKHFMIGGQEVSEGDYFGNSG